MSESGDILVLLMSTASAFAETQAIQEIEFLYKDLAQTAQETDHRFYVSTVGYKGGYNMGPYSKYGIMKGMPIPAHGSGGFKWGPCNRSMLSPTFVDGWIRNPGG